MSKVDIESIERNGVVGAGGAGFPTHVKFRSEAETFCVNAAECEPLLHKDKEVIKHYADEMLEGLQIGMRLVGAREGIIGIKYKYTDTIALLESKIPENVRILRLGDYYPAGDEFALVYEAVGRAVPPGGLPLHVGCIVSNVETLVNVARNRPVTRKYLSVVAHVNSPVTVEVPVGTPMRDVLPLAGGPISERFGVLEGGVMMGRLVEDLDRPITKTTGALIVLPDDHDLLRRYRRDWRGISRIGKAACDQCSFCTELCPRYLLGHPIEPHKAMRGLGFLMDRKPHITGTVFCCECNLCSMMACPEDLDPKNVCATFKKEIGKDESKALAETNTRAVHPFAEARRVPVSRLMGKLGLSDFNNVGPLIRETVSPRRVRIPLKQHVGAPSVPCVSVGDKVLEGQVLGEIPQGSLGAVVHASIAGRVAEVGEGIVIERE